MAKFPIKPFFEYSKDGSRKKQQVMLQTDPEAVIGLKPWMDTINNIIFKMTGTKVDGDKSPEFVTKGDLEDELRRFKKEITDTNSNILENAKKYTDNTVSNVVSNAKKDSTAYTDTKFNAVNSQIVGLQVNYDAKIKKINDDTLMFKPFSTFDLNDLIQPGIYTIPYGANKTLKNGPWKDNDSGILFVTSPGNDNISQVFISAIGDSAVLIRNKSGSPSSWQRWILVNAQG